MRRIIIVAFMLTINLAGTMQVLAQQALDHNRVEMADIFRQEGKIYVVVAIIGVVLAGMIIYTILIDRKLQRLEKEFETKN
jgi:Mn2+/Fe2+ NRAMP family transporter